MYFLQKLTFESEPHVKSDFVVLQLLEFHMVRGPRRPVDRIDWSAGK